MRLLLRYALAIPCWVSLDADSAAVVRAAQPVREAGAAAQGDPQPKKRRIDAPAQAAQETTTAGDQA